MLCSSVLVCLVWYVPGHCTARLNTKSFIGLCNLSLTTRREPDYARDRIWEKDPYNFDACLSENSDPYVVYVFGSDRATVSWDFRDEVRYC
jgi:hypothetical protein